MICHVVVSPLSGNFPGLLLGMTPNDKRLSLHYMIKPKIPWCHVKYRAWSLFTVGADSSASPSSDMLPYSLSVSAPSADFTLLLDLEVESSPTTSRFMVKQSYDTNLISTLLCMQGVAGMDQVLLKWDGGHRELLACSGLRHDRVSDTHSDGCT